MSVQPNDPTRLGSSPEGCRDDTVALSLPETRALCARAARGAGLDWGHADETGWAAACLAGQGWPAPALVRALLQGPSLAPPRPAVAVWPAPSGPMCPLRTGVALDDHAGLAEGPGAGPLVLEAVGWPALLLPFLSRAARKLQRGLRIRVHGVTLILAGDADAPACAGDPGAFSHPGRVEIDETGACVPPAAQRGRAVADVSRTDWNALDALALRVTVPPSAQSRVGAGSGGDDND